MPTKKPQPVHARAFLNMAYEYAEAAHELFILADTRPKIHGWLPLRSPLYLLYSHAAELALKAFLRAKNMPIPKTHELAKLYAESRRLGLVIGPRDRFEIGNIVSLLDSGNKYQGFRYFNLESGATADLSWVHEVIPELMRAVEPYVPDNIAPGVRVCPVTSCGITKPSEHEAD
jgi:HEPN domain-containing protein